MDYGIKISKEGINVETAIDEELYLTSKRKCLKIGEVRSTTITTNGSGNGTRTIAHGLSFRPVVIGFIEESSAWFQFPAVLPSNGLAICYIDSTNIVFDLLIASASTTYTIYYYVSETESAA